MKELLIAGGIAFVVMILIGVYAHFFDSDSSPEELFPGNKNPIKSIDRSKKL